MNRDLLQRPAVETRSEDRSLLFRGYEHTIVPWLLRRLPARLPPNAITLAGHCSAVLGLATAAVAVSGRPALYLLSGALFMAYLFSDILDGLHARRTGRITAAGEFLDHGLDTISGLSALLAVCLVVRATGAVLVAVVYLGMVASGAAYWELYRTGLLSAIGRSESFTGLASIELALYLFREPAWLRFSIASPTVATAIIAVVLLGALAALGRTVHRVARAGIPFGALACFAIAALAPVCYLLAGAEPWVVGGMIGLFSADVAVRSIRLRRQRRFGPLVVWPHAIAILPLAAVHLPGLPLSPAALGAAGLAVIYVRSIIGGLRECAREQQTEERPSRQA